MAVTTDKTNKPILPRGADVRPIDSYNRAAIYSGKALDFDGVNDTINVGRPSYMNITNGAITLACYARLDSTAANRHLFRQENGTPRILFAYQSGLDGISFGTYDGSTYSELDVAFEPSEKSAITNDVCFVVATQDTNGTRAIYLNGVLIGSDTRAQGVTCTNTSDLNIGSNSSVEVWNGLIANAKIFDVALTAAQIADLYNNPEKIVPTGVANTALKLWLPMQEGAGTTAYDGSSTENGPDLIVNGDFATDSDWTKGTGWSISGGVASHDSSLGPGDLYQEFDLTIGKSYKITIEITATDTSELYFMTGIGDYIQVTGSPIGVHSHIFVADESSHLVGVRGSGNWDGSVDNITLEELNFANHGTISGATYVNGVGAPVAQTAVIDWNKGSNLVAYSEDLQGNWVLNGATWTSGQDDPIGGTNAYKMTSTGSDPYLVQNATSGISGTQYTAKCWVKGAVGREARLWIIRDNVNFESEDFTLTGNWQEIETTKTFPTTPVSFVSFRLDIPNDSPGSGDIGYIFAPRLVAGDNADVYIPTFATAQTSPVLLPQGLTAGRDITGVNLFENVRKQGALNLDGSSFAEVHDNASVDIGSADDVTMEIWFNRLAEPKNAYPKWIDVGRGDSDETNYSFGSILKTDEVFVEWRTSSSGWIFTDTDVTFNKNEWTHLVITIEMTGANSSIKTYKNGVLSSAKSQGTARGTGGRTIIGRHRVNNYYGYDQLAQPRIYNRALTASEVLNNYNVTKNLYI